MPLHKIGRVGIVFYSEWEENRVYSYLDYVRTGGNCYMCVAEHLSDELNKPKDGEDSTFWRVVVDNSTAKLELFQNIDEKLETTKAELRAYIGEVMANLNKAAIVEKLPDTGEIGTLYLVANGGSDNNLYDEYIYINKGSGANPNFVFEKLGTKEIDLSGYYNKSEIDEILSKRITYADIFLNQIPELDITNSSLENELNKYLNIEQVKGFKSYEVLSTELVTTLYEREDTFDVTITKSYADVRVNFIDGSSKDTRINYLSKTYVDNREYIPEDIKSMLENDLNPIIGTKKQGVIKSRYKLWDYGDDEPNNWTYYHPSGFYFEQHGRKEYAVLLAISFDSYDQNSKKEFKLNGTSDNPNFGEINGYAVIKANGKNYCFYKESDGVKEPLSTYNTWIDGTDYEAIFPINLEDDDTYYRQSNDNGLECKLGEISENGEISFVCNVMIEYYDNYGY